jgi:ketosteroid isomerase-like protein
VAIAAIFDGSSVDRKSYDDILERTGSKAVEQPARSIHVAFENGDGFGVFDVWESEEALAAFGESVIGPAFASAGVDMPPPRVHRVHNTMGPHPAGRNVGTVAAIYEAFGRGDIPAILARMADDVDWESGAADHGIPWLIPGRGPAHVASFFERLQAIEIRRFEPFSLVPDGDRVIALIDLEAVVIETGRSFDDIELHLWTFDESGRVAAFRHFTDTIAHRAALEG